MYRMSPVLFAPCHHSSKRLTVRAYVVLHVCHCADMTFCRILNSSQNGYQA